MLQLRLLGPFAATVDSKPPIQVRIRSKKGQALLAFLAVQDGHNASRDQLIALLWGDPADVHPRQNLRQCLISLRTNLAQLAPDFLAIEKDRIGLSTQRLSIDVVDLEELAKSTDIADLERAAALYRGQFLADFRLGLRRFDDWLCAERSRIEPIAAHVLERWADRSDSAGDGERAIEAATQLLRLDPRREDWQRLLIRLYARYRGSDAAAARARWLTERLHREPAFAPATTALIADIQRAIALADPTAMLSTSGYIAEFNDLAKSECSLHEPKGPTKVPREKPSITVLPFFNLGDDEELGYLSRGIREDIITALVRAKSYCVLAVTSVCAETRWTSKTLSTGYVLCGAIRRLNDRVRITVRLVDSSYGDHIWAQAYTSKARDLFANLDCICSNVVAAVEPAVFATEANRSTRKPMHALDAHGCVMRALAVTKAGRTHENYVLAAQLSERAIQLDANYARAYSLSAYLAGASVIYGWKPRARTLPYAFDVAQKALLIDSQDPWAHFALGWVFTQNRAPELGVEEYEKAIALAPDFSQPHACLGLALGYLGQIDRALAEVDTAKRLGTNEVFIGLNNSACAGVLFCAGRHQDAIIAAQRSVQESPGLVMSQRQLVVNHALLGNIDEARVALKRFKQLVPNASLQSISNSLPNIRENEQHRILDAFHSLGLER